jgi:hypothetical protein
VVYIGGNDTLRSALSGSINGVQHRAKLKHIQATAAHTIRFVKWATHDNCFAYAFKLSGDFFQDAIIDHQIGADARFIRWLLQSDCLSEIMQPELNQECLVLYFNNTGTCKHAGLRCSDGRIRSQWGAHPIYKHELAEIPIEYGGVVRFFSPVAPKKAINLFKAYIQACNELPIWARPS